MPYTTKKVGSKTCVYKKDTGEKVGCTSGPIDKYLGALHANADESVGSTSNEGTMETLPQRISKEKIKRIKEIVRSIVTEVLKEQRFSK